MPIPAGPDDPILPDWAPDRSHVADYVPHRTLAKTAHATIGSQDVYKLTFDTDTRPTGWAVDRLILDGITYVTTRINPIPEALQTAAALVATLYAAIAVERSWPHDDQSLQRANDMERRMDALMTGLDQDADPEAHPLPVWAFPAPVPHGDSLL